MPYKITNITGKTLKKAIPLQITYGSGVDKVKKILEPEQFFFIFTLPKDIHQFQLRNYVLVEFVKDIQPDPVVIPINKDEKVIKSVTEVKDEQSEEITEEKVIKPGKKKKSDEELGEE